MATLNQPIFVTSKTSVQPDKRMKGNKKQTKFVEKSSSQKYGCPTKQVKRVSQGGRNIG
jgi:hypothetical protein